MTFSRKLTLPLPAAFVHWYVHMHHPRYEWPFKILQHTLDLTRVGVHKRAWGYPNLVPEDGIEAYDICQIYEGQVSLSKSCSYLVIIKSCSSDLIRSTSAIGSVPIHTDSCPRMH